MTLATSIPSLSIIQLISSPSIITPIPSPSIITPISSPSPAKDTRKPQNNRFRPAGTAAEDGG